MGSPTRSSLRSRSSVSSNDSRRFSAPPSPLETASLTGLLGDAQIADSPKTSRRPRRSRRAASPGDRRSFIDLSDEEGSTPEDALRSGFKRPTSPSALSLASLTTIETAQENRRKQRDRLAKLHRHLGSRVPAELVLGTIADDASLPSPEPVFDPPTHETDPKAWKRLRRRSSSAAEMKTRWFDDGERVKANLDEREKALNVRRAIKMEKLFGVPPPQTLYTRATSPGAGSPISASPTSRNPNQSAYINKGKATSGGRTPRRRTSTASDSRQNLLGEDGPSNPFADPSSSGHSRRASSVYMQYRFSLNSLNDMIDRDDKESIAEIHQYLTSTSELLPASDDEDPRTTTPTPTNTTNAPSPVPSSSDTSSLKSLRRRSLPVRASQLSLASQFTNSEEPAMKTFQTRRRRAAKLTSFFGVDYHTLVGDILESIEEDVEQESQRGGLQPHEAQDLLQKLRKLKTRRF
ncbi:hypothetical protein PENSPDRAFT_653944 [Peniophora sp. CONT]|nr:hypothetical protein PENSPDRAFT_653944 [Peniophora sp. CONT]